MALITAQVNNETDIVEYVVDQPLVTVHLTNKRTGITATGHAKCDDSDIWDQGFGLDLAYIRAMARVSKKLEKFYVNRLSKHYSRS
jgi:hypothetical protein